MSINIGSTELSKIALGVNEAKLVSIGSNPIYVCEYTIKTSTDVTNKWSDDTSTDNYVIHYSDEKNQDYVESIKTLTITIPQYIQSLVKLTGATVKCRIQTDVNVKTIANSYGAFGQKEQGYTTGYLTITQGSSSTSSAAVATKTITPQNMWSKSEVHAFDTITFDVTVASGITSITCNFNIRCVRTSTANIQGWHQGKFTKIKYEFYASAPTSIAQTPQIVKPS